MSAAEGASEGSSPEQANECAIRANERTDEQVAQLCSLYSWLFWPTVRWGKWQYQLENWVYFSVLGSTPRVLLVHRNCFVLFRKVSQIVFCSTEFVWLGFLFCDSGYSFFLKLHPPHVFINIPPNLHCTFISTSSPPFS